MVTGDDGGVALGVFGPYEEDDDDDEDDELDGEWADLASGVACERV